MNTHAGGCHCGALRYRVAGELSCRTLCHCTICRATTGAPAVAWFTVPLADFAWLQGAPRRYDSTPGATRSFCGGCGAQLTFWRHGLDEIDVTIASLDDAAALAPEDQTFTRSELPWMQRLAALPRHAAARPEPGGSGHPGDGGGGKTV